MINLLWFTKSVFLSGKRFFFASSRNTILFFLLGSITTQCSHFSKKRTNETALNLAHKLAQLDPQKGFDGWLDFNINQFPILLIDKHSLRTHLIQNGRATFIPPDEVALKVTKTQQTFDTLSFRGQEALVLFYNSKLENNEDLSALNLTYFAVHEGFHLFYQTPVQGFQQQPIQQSRGNLYPILDQPRYMRHEMFRALNQYLQTSNPQFLNAYSWWYFRWYKHYQEEATTYTDRIEGSAQFYSNQALTHIHNGKTSSTLTPFQHFQKVLMKEGDKSKWFGLDTEAYLLGPLAGMILNKLGKESWKLKVNQKDSPLLLLARMYKPKRQKIDLKTKEEYLLMAVQKMREIDQDGVLDQAISQLAAPSTIRLALAHGPGVEISGFKTDGIYRSFFNFQDTTGIVFIPLTSPVQINTPRIQIRQQPRTALVISQKNPCSPQTGGPLFLFSSEKVKLKGRQVQTYSKPYLNTKAHKILQKSGITWVCLNSFSAQ